jgi:hypothetical protein
MKGVVLCEAPAVLLPSLCVSWGVLLRIRRRMYKMAQQVIEAMYMYYKMTQEVISPTKLCAYVPLRGSLARWLTNELTRALLPPCNSVSRHEKGTEE